MTFTNCASTYAIHFLMKWEASEQKLIMEKIKKFSKKWRPSSEKTYATVIIFENLFRIIFHIITHLTTNLHYKFPRIAFFIKFTTQFKIQS